MTDAQQQIAKALGLPRCLFWDHDPEEGSAILAKSEIRFDRGDVFGWIEQLPERIERAAEAIGADGYIGWPETRAEMFGVFVEALK